MNRRPWRIVSIIILAASTFLSCQGKAPEKLVIWTYDSFVAEWGPAEPLQRLWEASGGGALEFVSKGDSGVLLGVLGSRGRDVPVDIVIGLDDRLASQALESGFFAPAQAPNAKKLPARLFVDPSGRLIPYDYGQFALIWDSESGIPAPESLEDLTKPLYEKKLILMDPRSSTPGLGFLAWTQAAYGEAWEDYWRRLAPSVLTMAPGWDTGYGLFTRGEAPLVISYTTSPAYHKANESSERYKALVFSGGHTAQIELAGVLKDSRHRKEAERFLNFLISDEAQALLPETQWMYPANPGASLPASFSVVPKDLPILEARLEDPSSDPEKAVSILASARR